MNKKEFFQELKEGLPDDAYKKRFLSELEDHLEDAEYAAHFKKSPDDLSPLERLGEPESIIINYKKIMRKYATFFIQLEVLFWGFVMAMFYTLPFIGTALTENVEMVFIKTLILLVTLAVVGGIFYFLYRFLYSMLAGTLLSLSGIQKIAAFALSVMPGWMFAMLLIVDLEAQGAYFPLVIVIYLIAITGSAAMAYFYSGWRKINSPAKPLLFESIVLAYGIFFFFYLLEPGLLAWDVLIQLSDTIGQLNLLNLISLIVAASMAVYCAYSLYKSWAQKSIPSLIKISILGFLLYGLFFPHDPGLKYVKAEDINLEWHKPVTDITKTVDNGYFKPFQGWASFNGIQNALHENYGPIIPTEDGKFFIMISGRKAYGINPSSASFEGVINVDPIELEGKFLAELETSKELECSPKQDQCESLTYKGTKILSLTGKQDGVPQAFQDVRDYFFQVDYELLPTSISYRISSDEKYLLLRFIPGVYPGYARSIYLVELD